MVAGVLTADVNVVALEKLSPNLAVECAPANVVDFVRDPSHARSQRKGG